MLQRDKQEPNIEHINPQAGQHRPFYNTILVSSFFTNIYSLSQTFPHPITKPSLSQAPPPALLEFTTSALSQHSSITFQNILISNPLGILTPSLPGSRSFTTVRPVCAPFSSASSRVPSVTTRTSNLSRLEGPSGFLGSKS